MARTVTADATAVARQLAPPSWVAYSGPADSSSAASINQPLEGSANCTRAPGISPGGDAATVHVFALSWDLSSTPHSPVAQAVLPVAHAIEDEAMVIDVAMKSLGADAPIETALADGDVGGDVNELGDKTLAAGEEVDGATPP